jgi:hypothetical protein
LKIPNGKKPATQKPDWSKVHHIVYHFKIICDFIQSSDHRFNIISIDAAAKPKKIEKQQFVVFHWSLTLQKYSLNNMFNKIFERNTLSFSHF